MQEQGQFNMTQALNLANFANNLNTAGATSNTGLQNSSVTVIAGTGMSGGGAVALGSSVTLTNTGVTSVAAGTGISVSGSTGAVTINASAYPLTSGTAVASTSGTSIDFTSIPSWVKRITVMYSGVSTNGTSDFWLRLGTSGGFATSGYLGYNLRDAGSGNSYTALSSAFIVTAGGASASELFQGNIVITNQTGNVWIATGQVTGSNNTGNFNNLAGYVSLSGTLTQIRLTSASSDTFDAGSINILYE